MAEAIFLSNLTTDDGHCVDLPGQTIYTATNTYFGLGIRSFLKFDKIKIPSGSVITHAYLQLYASETSTGDANVNVYFNDIDNVETAPTTYSQLIGLDLTNGVSWDIESWTNGSLYDSVDIKDALQEVINREGWEYENSIMCITADAGGSSDTRRAYGYNTSSTNYQPRLYVEWVEQNHSGDFSPAVSGDDGYLLPPLDFRNATAYFQVANDYISFVRFPNVTIPSDAIVKYAYLKYAASMQSTSTGTMNIYLNDVGDAVAPVNYLEVLTADLTDPVIDTPHASNQNGIFYNSCDITTIVQEIISRPDWESGNALQVFLTKESGSLVRTITSIDSGDGSNKVVLHIVWGFIEPVEEDVELQWMLAEGTAQQVELSWNIGWFPTDNDIELSYPLTESVYSDKELVNSIELSADTELENKLLQVVYEDYVLSGSLSSVIYTDVVLPWSFEVALDFEFINTLRHGLISDTALINALYLHYDFSLVNGLAHGLESGICVLRWAIENEIINTIQIKNTIQLWRTFQFVNSLVPPIYKDIGLRWKINNEVFNTVQLKNTIELSRDIEFVNALTPPVYKDIGLRWKINNEVFNTVQLKNTIELSRDIEFVNALTPPVYEDIGLRWKIDNEVFNTIQLKNTIELSRDIQFVNALTPPIYEDFALSWKIDNEVFNTIQLKNTIELSRDIQFVNALTPPIYEDFALSWKIDNEVFNTIQLKNTIELSRDIQFINSLTPPVHEDFELIYEIISSRMRDIDLRYNINELDELESTFVLRNSIGSFPVIYRNTFVD